MGFIYGHKMLFPDAQNKYVWKDTSVFSYAVSLLFLSFHPPPLLPSPHPLSSLDLSLVSLSFIQRESLKLRYDSWDTSEGSCTPTFCCFTSSFQLFLLPFLISLTFDIYIPSSSSITEQLALSLHRPISLPADGCVGR